MTSTPGDTSDTDYERRDDSQPSSPREVNRTTTGVRSPSPLLHNSGLDDKRPSRPSTPNSIINTPFTPRSTRIGNNQDGTVKDARFRKYEQHVEKNLQMFDTVAEWADIIAFLTKLKSTLQLYPQYNTIPKKGILAKRLAQCLNPALPSGVHQRTLEVYYHVFETIGREGLENDLDIWSMGLFPFVQYAATSAKPLLFTMFERFYLPLGYSLRPIIRSFVSALLPAIEEENSEFFDRGIALLATLSRTVETSHFYSSLWLVMISNASLRQPALNYLLRRMPKVDDPEEMAVTVGNELSLMIRAFTAVLQDTQMLVQRAMLELLVSNFPLDKQFVQEDDLAMLAQAAITVVQRRDMSLNRRLYFWLLGPSDERHEQGAYFRTYGEKALTMAMSKMFAIDTTDVAVVQRPYKILVSLMDKSEIAQPILSTLLLDVLRSLQRNTMKLSQANELLQTGSMFLEMMEPSILWSQLYNALIAPDNCFNDEILTLIEFLVDRFKFSDEETCHVHIPMFVLGVFSVIKLNFQHHDVNSYQIAIAVAVTMKLSERIPQAIMDEDVGLVSERPQSDSSSDPQPDTLTGGEQADSLSGYIRGFFSLADGERQSEAFKGIQLLSLLRTYTSCIVSSILQELAQADRDSLLQVSQSLMTSLGTSCQTMCRWFQLRSKDEEDLPLSDDTREAANVLYTYSTDHVNSIVIDCTLPTIFVLDRHDHRLFQERLWSHGSVRALVATLWSFFDEAYFKHHFQATRLLWELSDSCHSQPSLASNTMELTIAEYLLHHQLDERLIQMERFALFWRYSEEKKRPVSTLRRPIFVLMDCLREDALPEDKQMAEMWLRSYCRSYVHILEPAFEILFNPSINARALENNVNEVKLPYLECQRAFDYAQVDYAFSTVLNVAGFGGQGFVKNIRAAGLIQQYGATAPFMREPTNYLELLMNACLRYISMEPTENLQDGDNQALKQIRIHAAELLHAMTSRMDVLTLDQIDELTTFTLKSLARCVDAMDLSLQPRLLLILHNVLPVALRRDRNLNSPLAKPGRRTSYESTIGDTASPDIGRSSMDQVLTPANKRVIEQLFTVALTMALSQDSNRLLLQNWLDLLLASLGSFRDSFRAVILPMLQLVCYEIDRAGKALKAVHHDQHERTLNCALQTNTSRETSQQAHTIPLDSNMLLLLTAMERILLFCLSDPKIVDDKSVDTNDTDPKPLVKTASDTSLKGLASLLIGAVDSDDESSDAKARDTIWHNMTSMLDLLVRVWFLFDHKYTPNATDGRSEVHVEQKIRTKIQRFIGRLNRAFTVELLESLTDLFLLDNPGIVDSEAEDYNARVFQFMKDIPFLTPKTFILALLDGARFQSTGSNAGAKYRRIIDCQSKSSDIAILKTLELYIADHLSPEHLIDVWSQCYSFVREYGQQASTFKYLFFPLLRFFHVLYMKLSETNFFEDKRYRREGQDTYQRLLDFNILIAGKSFDQGLWSRRAAILDDNNLPASLSIDNLSAINSTNNDSSHNLVDLEKRPSAKSRDDLLVGQINHYLARHSIPEFRRLLIDADRINTIATNLVYYVVGPLLKAHISLSKITVILEQLAELAKQLHTYRTWRKEVWDFFTDNRFFDMSEGISAFWKGIINSMMVAERDRFPELLARVTTSPSGALFTNKDQEVSNRSLNLRRISYVIFSGAKDQYLAQLPAVQEKLVELLKLDHSEMIHYDAYLCLRILLIRFSSKHLSNFWPVLLADMMHLFDLVLRGGFDDKPEEADIVMAVCKFLDLACVLEIEAFQIFQWIFIRDTVDATAIDGGRNSRALVDRVASSIDPESLDPLSLDGEPTSIDTLKRPMLTTRHIASLKELYPFFSHISAHAYRQTYALAQPDIDFIEKLVEGDLLEANNVSM